MIVRKSCFTRRQVLGALGGWLLVAGSLPGVGASAGEPPTASAGAKVAASNQAPHWSFIAPKRPGVPTVREAGWIRNPIDSFILARLEKEHIAPSPEAPRSTLVRRLSLDLTGLPPTAGEVEAFVRDRRPDAYEFLVERLLASPHFGERWGRYWLDLARYADSDGYEKDQRRPHAYVYRDWVIDAINRDLPFDQFTVEQFAGDLLPGATVEQKKATGFQRQTLTNTEGGADQEEFRCKAIVDRVSTLGAVWLGLTLGCAECHSHKSDPIAQREFYQLFAFFNDASEKDIPTPPPADLARYETALVPWEEESAERKGELDTYAASQLPERARQWAGRFEPSPILWRPVEPWRVTGSGKTTFDTRKDYSIVAASAVAEDEVWTIEADASVASITGFRLEILPDLEKSKESGNGETALREFEVSVRTEGSGLRLVGLENARAVFSAKEKPVGAAIDGKGDTGWGLKPESARNHEAVFETRENLEVGQGSRLVFVLRQHHGKQRALRRFRISATSAPRPLAVEPVPAAIREILIQAEAKRDEAGRKAVADYYRDQVDEVYEELRAVVAKHHGRKPSYPPVRAATLVQEGKPRVTQVHLRGDFLRKGEEVQPAPLAVLHPFAPAGPRPDRLDLARWIVDPANPLTRRVTVNRIWRGLFGSALVQSEADFGVRGEKPSHPDLLDWLSTEFSRRGWSRKEMIRLIVSSSAYRQSSNVRPELADGDPLNRLLARQNRFRLEAEVVRDSYLAASGLLSPELSGPSVFPPLPADIAALGYADMIQWQESKGKERYRRGLYIFFQRTVPYPMLTTFDAADSMATCTRRERSNTPLQALTLLNDPVFFECAQALGRRLAEAPDAQPAQAVRRTFQLCLSRPPTAEEQGRLEDFYREHLRMARKNLEGARQITGSAGAVDRDPAEAATLVALARTILNLDEFVTRE